MSETERLQTVTVLRRINLGSYQHYEISVTISDPIEKAALYRALVLMVMAYNALGCTDKIDVSKVQ